MKTLKIFPIALFLVSMSLYSFAQTSNDHNNPTVSVKTESFKVWGKCSMCKSRIEKAVLEEGAKSASWDIKTQILTVTFNPLKTNKDDLSKKLASVGHDTEKYKALDEVYAKLPSCCHYERSK
jgi:copper chaperone CopZ